MRAKNKPTGYKNSKDTAAFTGINTKKLRTLAMLGKIPYIWYGATRWFKDSDMVWMKEMYGTAGPSRIRYPNDIKTQVVKLWLRNNMAVSQIASELKVPLHTAYFWIRNYRLATVEFSRHEEIPDVTPRHQVPKKGYKV